MSCHAEWPCQARCIVAHVSAKEAHVPMRGVASCRARAASSGPTHAARPNAFPWAPSVLEAHATCNRRQGRHPFSSQQQAQGRASCLRCNPRPRCTRRACGTCQRGAARSSEGSHARGVLRPIQSRLTMVCTCNLTVPHIYARVECPAVGDGG